MRPGAAGLLYLHVPMFFILLYAFTTDDKSYQFPPPGLTVQWFAVAWERPDIWNALFLSVRVALAFPEPFHTVGQGYRDFDQVPDASVVRLLRPPGGDDA